MHCFQVSSLCYASHTGDRLLHNLNLMAVGLFTDWCDFLVYVLIGDD